MVCKKCGAPLLEDDQFCPECGAKVIRKKRCPECGETLREGTRFCPSCGSEVGEERRVKKSDSEETPRRREVSEETPRRREVSEETPRRRAVSEETPKRRTNPDAPRRKASPAPPPKKRPVQDERPRRRRDWEDEDWDDEDWDDDEENVDILSIMTVAVGCILLVIVAVLGFNLYQRYVPKNYDKAADEQETEAEEGDDGEEEQEDGQRLEDPPEDSNGSEQEEMAAASVEGTVVAVADVRIRDNPSTQGTTVITTAKKGDSYEYAEVVEGGHWYKIYLPDEYGYEFGYVSADYVEQQ
ncbi:MAG: zinc-ribbon domain-containing protein [Lachnospiraceae bacterium]|nr:zinc-ribbon domain-containing protein [Lachnospiraceae bacterium]